MDWKAYMADIEGQIGAFAKEAPETVRGFGVMGKAAKADGALSEKTKEFIALGIAVSTRCESCIGFHVRSLVRLGGALYFAATSVRCKLRIVNGLKIFQLLRVTKHDP